MDEIPLLNKVPDLLKSSAHGLEEPEWMRGLTADERLAVLPILLSVSNNVQFAAYAVGTLSFPNLVALITYLLAALEFQIPGLLEPVATNVRTILQKIYPVLFDTQVKTLGINQLPAEHLMIVFPTPRGLKTVAQQDESTEMQQ